MNVYTEGNIGVSWAHSMLLKNSDPYFSTADLYVSLNLLIQEILKVCCTLRAVSLLFNILNLETLREVK